MDSRLLELLVCPVSGAALRYDSERQELVCRASAVAYPLKDGVPVLLAEADRPLSDEELARLN